MIKLKPITLFKFLGYTINNKHENGIKEHITTIKANNLVVYSREAPATVLGDPRCDHHCCEGCRVEEDASSNYDKFVHEYEACVFQFYFVEMSLKFCDRYTIKIAGKILTNIVCKNSKKPKKE